MILPVHVYVRNTVLNTRTHTHTHTLGEDGPSQMALEDFAMFRSIPGAACFYPSDAVSCERAIELAANYKGVTFTRTSRPATAVIYNNDETFEIGKGKVSALQFVPDVFVSSSSTLCFITDALF